MKTEKNTTQTTTKPNSPPREPCPTCGRYRRCGRR